LPIAGLLFGAGKHRLGKRGVQVEGVSDSGRLATSGPFSQSLKHQEEFIHAHTH